MSSSPAYAAAAPESSSAIGRMLGALFSPRKTFESIARRPTWLPPVVLACLIALAVVALFTHRVGWRSYLDKQVANSSRFQQLSAEQQQRTMEAQLKWTPRVAYAEVFIAPFARCVDACGDFSGHFKRIGRDEIQLQDVARHCIVFLDAECDLRAAGHRGVARQGSSDDRLEQSGGIECRSISSG